MNKTKIIKETKEPKEANQRKTDIKKENRSNHKRKND